MQKELDRMDDDPNYIPQVDVGKLYMVEDPLPHERAVLILSRCYQYEEDADYVSVSWANQVRAANYYNTHGLNDTLKECLRINPESLR